MQEEFQQGGTGLSGMDRGFQNWDTARNSAAEQATLSAISTSMLLPDFHFLLLLRHLIFCL